MFLKFWYKNDNPLDAFQNNCLFIIINKILYKLKIKECCRHEGGGEEYIGLTKIIKLF